jgi:predicted DNA-binding protein (UPF0251 family)
MTTWYADTPAWYRDAAERVCTAKQLEVLRLASHELTQREIADRLGITRQAVFERFNLASTKIRRHLEQEPAA